MTTSGNARRAAAGPAGLRRVGPGGRVAIAAVAVAVAAGGCATVPTSGAVEQLGGVPQAGAGQQQDYSQLIIEGPRPGWSAGQIVDGFLAANASFANDHAVAREYLDPTAQKKWHPGWAVDVVSGWQVSAPVSYRKQFEASQPGGGYAKVVVTGGQVATYNAGQSLVSSPKQNLTFSLVKNSDGQWRISNPPPTLLLTQDDFKLVYQPRNLYFLAGTGQTLVPDPVFVPQQDTNTQLATGLVTALLQDPRGWLQGAAVTGFPQHSQVIGQVKINGPNAIVDLGGKAATANRWQQEQMAAQLVWTLASGPTAIQSVEMEINGRPVQIAHNPLQLLEAYHSWMPTQSAGSSLYFLDGHGSVKSLSGVGQPGSGQTGSVTAVQGPAGTPAVPPLHSIAVSPDGRWIAGISAGGKVVYAWDLARKAALRVWPSSSGTCTSLSWDRQGDLWITAGGTVWLLPPGKDSAVQVSPPGDAVTAFGIAPDGVRAVMIVNNTQLQLVAITHSGSQSPAFGDPVVIGSGITDPEALSWFDANNVIVLYGSSSGGQLAEVPLNGGGFNVYPADGDVVSVTATSPSGASPQIAIGLSGGQIMVSANLGTFERTHAMGQAPAYPG